LNRKTTGTENLLKNYPDSNYTICNFHFWGLPPKFKPDVLGFKNGNSYAFKLYFVKNDGLVKSHFSITIRVVIPAYYMPE
jgi:hypothetical protein